MSRPIRIESQATMTHPMPTWPPFAERETVKISNQIGIEVNSTILHSMGQTPTVTPMLTPALESKSQEKPFVSHLLPQNCGCNRSLNDATRSRKTLYR
jgi:hypothetical protein